MNVQGGCCILFQVN